MSSFRKRTILKRQVSEGSYIKGVYKLSADGVQEIPIMASVQSLNGQDMQLLDENRREIESYKIYSDTQLFAVVKDSGKNPDIVVIDGSDFEVVKVFPNKNNVINHYKAIVQKVVSKNIIPTS